MHTILRTIALAALAVSADPPIRLSAQAAQKTSELYTKRVEMVPMRDGIKLNTEIYVPKTGTGPRAIMLTRTPYGLGHDADGFAQGVMDNAIIPPFKQGRLDQGICNGVAALGDLAEAGPGGVPQKKAVDTVVGWAEEVAGPGQVSTSLLPKHIIFSVTAIGVILIGLSFVFPSQRTLLLVLGIGLIVTVWLTWVVILVLALLSKGKSKSGGGFSSSGGFGTGGFSGGGGASGSW